MWIQNNFNTIRDTILESTKYAILSHTWDDGELVYSDILSKNFDKRGYAKFRDFCVEAQSFTCRYAWMDSACIDSTSSSELDESIRSMYHWYKKAFICLIVLTSSPHENEMPWVQQSRLARDRWFRRGWTLQELLAPRAVKFYWQDWSEVTESNYDIIRDSDVDTNPDFEIDEDTSYTGGLQHGSLIRTSQKERIRKSQPLDSESLTLEMLAEAAGVDNVSLVEYKPSPANARKVFQWMARRRTSRPEDIAYCLLGLLDVQLTIAYGEGRRRAFYRLQIECSQQSDDRHLFIWNTKPSRWNSMFAEEPAAFVDRPGEATFDQGESLHVDKLFINKSNRRDPSFTFTNHGLRISLILLPIPRTSYRVFQLKRQGKPPLFTYKIWSLSPKGSKVELLFRWSGHLDEPEAEINEEWKIGILGTFGRSAVTIGLHQVDDDSSESESSSPPNLPPKRPLRKESQDKGDVSTFGILLKKASKSSPRYVRIASAKLACVAGELDQNLQTIFIA